VNNPWIAGSFYLSVAVLVIFAFAVLSNVVSAWVLPPVLSAAILLVVTVGILQLRNDDRMEGDTFRELVLDVLHSLPVIGRRVGHVSE
jgi:hypothetical protein